MKNTETLLQRAKTPSPDVSNFQRELRGRVTRPKPVSFAKPFYIVSAMAACMIFAFVLLFMSFDQQLADKELYNNTPAMVTNQQNNNLPSPKDLPAVAVDVTPVSNRPVTYYEVIIVEDDAYSQEDETLSASH